MTIPLLDALPFLGSASLSPHFHDYHGSNCTGISLPCSVATVDYPRAFLLRFLGVMELELRKRSFSSGGLSRYLTGRKVVGDYSLSSDLMSRDERMRKIHREN